MKDIDKLRKIKKLRLTLDAVQAREKEKFEVATKAMQACHKAQLETDKLRDKIARLSRG